MKRSRARNLAVEGIESRVLLSGMAAAHRGAAVEVGAIAASGLVRLQGTIIGTVHSSHANPDTGLATGLNGQGLLQKVGHVSVKGTLHATGFIASGASTGVMSLKAHSGTLLLTLEGPPQRGFSDLPSHYTYSITGGTGKYAGATGLGTLDYNQIKFFGKTEGFQIKFHAATA